MKSPLRRHAVRLWSQSHTWVVLVALGILVVAVWRLMVAFEAPTWGRIVAILAIAFIGVWVIADLRVVDSPLAVAERPAPWWRRALRRARASALGHVVLTRVLWLLGAVALVALLLSAVLHWPAVIVGDTSDLTREQALKAENDVRGTLLTGIAGGLFLVTAFLSWRQVQVTREGHLTDRFAKAVEQLGARPEREGAPDPLDVRLGGVYSLERIWRDSPKDRPTVVAVLGAFVREHSQLHGAEEICRECSGRKTKRGYPTDLQSALTVLGRLRHGHVDLVRADLAGSILHKADLSNGDLHGADLSGADLTEAKLAGANLDGADLHGACLNGANLVAATLVGADLTEADLIEADLHGADLIANLSQANLSHANLSHANLFGGTLLDSYMSDVNLYEANLIDAVLCRAELSNANLTKAWLLGADLSNATLVGANLGGAHLHGACLDGANLTDARFDADTVWPEHLPEGINSVIDME